MAEENPTTVPTFTMTPELESVLARGRNIHPTFPEDVQMAPGLYGILNPKYAESMNLPDLDDKRGILRYVGLNDGMIDWALEKYHADFPSDPEQLAVPFNDYVCGGLAEGLRPEFAIFCGLHPSEPDYENEGYRDHFYVQCYQEHADKILRKWFASLSLLWEQKLKMKEESNHQTEVPPTKAELEGQERPSTDHHAQGQLNDGDEISDEDGNEAAAGGPLDDFAFYQARFGHEGHEESHEWIKSVWVILQQYSRDGSPIRALVSGKGRYCGEHSWVGTDPRTIGYRQSHRLYRELELGTLAFPVHWPCYELLLLALFGSSDVSQPDMDALFSTLQSLTAYSAANLELDYGLDRDDPRQSYWTYRPGQDWLLEDPSRSEETEAYLRDVLSRADFTLPNPSHDLASKIVCDPFKRLPLEIIHMVASNLDLTDLLRLSSASWIVNVELRDDRMFWVTILKSKLMPFYVELRELDRKEEGLLYRHNPKDICVWFNWSTSPELGDLSAVPGVVNRRRIWKTCLQLRELHQIYTATLPGQATSAVSPFTEFGSNSLVFGHTYRTAWPYPRPSASDRRPERYQPLLHSWEALANSKHLVVLSSGKELRFGETDDGHYMRPLIPSRDGATIVGLSCQYGLVYGHDRAVYYSVVDALPPTDNPENQDQQESQLFDWGSEPELLAQYLWKSDYRDVLGGVRICEFPGLHLVLPVRNVFTWYSTRDNPLPLAMGGLFWATNVADFARLTRLSVCIVKEDVSICALKVESGPAVGTGGAPLRQMMGIDDAQRGQWHTFEVDGARGEFITKITVTAQGSRFPCQALRITTNYKEGVWGGPDGDFDRLILAPAGERLVGLVGIFGKPGWQHADNGLSALAGLSIAL
ncbi:hypothetical protein PG984_016170 [Apiospora sp. TS-2023a]